jgi:hypothetical protein
MAAATSKHASGIDSAHTQLAVTRDVQLPAVHPLEQLVHLPLNTEQDRHHVKPFSMLRTGDGHMLFRACRITCVSAIAKRALQGFARSPSPSSHTPLLYGLHLVVPKGRICFIRQDSADERQSAHAYMLALEDCSCCFALAAQMRLPSTRSCDKQIPATGMHAHCACYAADE